MKNKLPLLLAATCSLLLPVPRLATGAAEEAALYRDEFGIPHVSASTLEASPFAVGYPHAEDRLAELLKNNRRASGPMSEVFGSGNCRNDMIARIFRHQEISGEKYGQLSAKVRGVIESHPFGLLDVSDHEEIGLWDDQAEKLFSRSKATPTYFMNRKELVKRVTATKILRPTIELPAPK